MLPQTVMAGVQDNLKSAPSNNDEILDIIGSLDNLNTSQKDNLVTAINDCFTSASNGKKLLAETLTGYGVSTLETATFSEINSGIDEVYTQGVKAGELKTTNKTYSIALQETKTGAGTYTIPSGCVYLMFSGSQNSTTGGCTSSCPAYFFPKVYGDYSLTIYNSSGTVLGTLYSSSANQSIMLSNYKGASYVKGAGVTRTGSETCSKCGYKWSGSCTGTFSSVSFYGLKES